MYPEALISFWGMEVDLYSLMFLAGVVACLFVLWKVGTHLGIERKALSTYVDLAILSVIVGAATSMLFQGFYNLIDTGSFADEDGAVGMTFLGGLIGGAATFIVGMLFFIAEDKRVHNPKLVEIAPACIALAHAFGRLGCFFAGCCYGKPTDSWVGVTFEGHSHSVIPTNLIESIFLFLLFGVLLTMAVKKINFAMITYLISYGLFRFIIEFYRGDDRGAFIPGISPSQAWSILMILGGLTIVYLRYFHHQLFPKLDKEANVSKSKDEDATPQDK